MSLLTVLAEGPPASQPHVSTTLWVGTILAIAGILFFDVKVLGRDHFHAPSTKKVLLTWLFYVGLAGAMAVFLWLDLGAVAAQEFISGYITEQSLSFDNLFMFLTIFMFFAVPREFQQRVLTWAIIGAIVMRLGALLVGYKLLESIGWMSIVFGVFLLITAVKVAFMSDEDPDIRETRLYKLVTKYVPTTPDYHADKFMVSIGGKRLATPLTLVMILTMLFDLLFAVDSVPAVLAVTQDSYIAFVATTFALMGMRQEFFLLSSIEGKTIGLNLGLGIILGFVGIKLIIASEDFVAGLEWLVQHLPHEIPTSQSLGFIFLVLGIVAVVSLVSYFRNRGKVTEAEMTVLSPDEVAFEIYLASGRTLDDEWKTGLMRDYATEAVRVGGRYDTGEGIQVYGAASEGVEALATVRPGFLVDVERPNLGGGPGIVNAIHHAAELARNTIGRVVAVIVSDAIGEVEQAIRQAMVNTPDNLRLEVVYVSSEPGGADLLKRLEQYNISKDIVHTIIATNDDGTPKERIDRELDADLAPWLALPVAV